ncbi:hypothetical protein [Achromobacter kerstersii]
MPKFLMDILNALPTVATSPYALIGYLVTIAAWTYAMHRSVRLKVLMGRLEDIPEAERARVIQLEMGEVLPSNISAEQWIRARNHRHFLLAGIAMLVTLTVIGAVAVNAATERAKLRQEEAGREEERAANRSALLAKRALLKSQIEKLENEYHEAQLEYVRGANGAKFGPPDQQSIALDIIKAASEKGLKVAEEKRAVQKELDALPLP